MYQVSHKCKTPDGEPYYDYIFVNNEDIAVDYSNYLKTRSKFSDIRITPNAIHNLVDANQEIVRLRKLLSQAYIELQQMKKGYNEFIQTR